MEVGVLGGGAGGMMAALFAARAGAHVALLEQNEKLGKKLFITGKGRCNLTNAAKGQDFLAGVVRNPRFLYSALHFFSNEQLCALMEGEAGVPLKVERGGRVFPASDKSSDVLKGLERLLGHSYVRVSLRTRVLALEPLAQGGFLVTTNLGQKRFDRIVLATGGLSYPSTGSDGSGFALARTLGHRIEPLLPSLAPIETVEEWPKGLSGLTLKNVTLTAKRGKKKLFFELGEMLFTHFGISGPLVLSLSAKITGEPLEDIGLQLDLKPGLTQEQLLARLDRDIAQAPKKQLQSLLHGLEPKALSPILALQAGVAEETPCYQLNDRQKQALALAVKGLPLRPKALRPVEEAIVTRGGVSVKEVDPHTMESKLVKGLYFAGEMLDVDAVTGGYNLQIAFSTGALAGHSAAGGEEALG